LGLLLVKPFKQVTTSYWVIDHVRCSVVVEACLLEEGDRYQSTMASTVPVLCGRLGLGRGLRGAERES